MFRQLAGQGKCAQVWIIAAEYSCQWLLKLYNISEWSKKCNSSRWQYRHLAAVLPNGIPAILNETPIVSPFP